jgi:hypothetical protein
MTPIDATAILVHPCALDQIVIYVQGHCLEKDEAAISVKDVDMVQGLRYRYICHVIVHCAHGLG